MRKHFLLTKTLLVALLCLVGQSAWATPTTIYGRAVTADLENGYTAWSASDIGSGNWGGNATFVEGTGIQMSGNGNRNTSKSFTITENSLLTIDFSFDTGVNTGNASNYTTYDIGEDIQIWFNQQNQVGKVIINGVESAIANACKKDVNRNNDLWTVHMEIDTSKDKLTAMTLLGRDGATKASYTLTDAVTLSHNITTSLTASFHIYRSAGNLNTCLKSIRIQEEEQAVTNVGYTVNYKLGDVLVKTVAGTSVVDAVISADVAIDGTESGYEGNHYLITANEAPSMTLVATAASNVLNVPVRAPYTATLTVTRSVGGVAETPVVTNLTETDAKVCSWSYAYPMYVKKDDVYYIADVTSSFGETGTFTDGQSISKSVTYTNIDPLVVYFGEPNETAGNNVAYSNGNTGYITGGVTYEKDDVIRLGVLPAGTYRLITNVTGNANRYVVVGNCTDTSEFPTALVTITTTGAKDELFTLAAATPISISGKDQGSGKFNQSADVDYILVKKAGVPATLGTNGYATFASPYALDLTTANLPSDVTAYKASVSGTTVTFTALDQTVPANTGVLLKGTGTVNIPVAATGTAVEGNDFLVNNGGATFTGDDSYYYFGLLKDSDPLTFRKFDPSATAIPADKAYLKVLKSSVDATARGLEFVFDDEVTSIGEELRVKSEEFAPAAEFYDLQGRKVAQPTKGLYIVNGKKVVLK